MPAARTEDFSALLDWGLRLTLMLTLPASLALAMLAVPLLSTLFQYGAFAASDVLRTREALVAYSIGLTGLILVKVLAPGFYARQDIRTPVKIALITLALTQLMNFAFIGWLKHAGLALSIGLASCLNAGLLWRGLRQRGVYQPQAGWGVFMLKLARRADRPRQRAVVRQRRRYGVAGDERQPARTATVRDSPGGNR